MRRRRRYVGECGRFAGSSLTRYLGQEVAVPEVMKAAKAKAESSSDSSSSESSSESESSSDSSGEEDEDTAEV